MAEPAALRHGCSAPALVASWSSARRARHRIELRSPRQPRRCPHSATPLVDAPPRVLRSPPACRTTAYREPRTPSPAAQHDRPAGRHRTALACPACRVPVLAARPAHAPSRAGRRAASRHHAAAATSPRTRTLPRRCAERTPPSAHSVGSHRLAAMAEHLELLPFGRHGRAPPPPCTPPAACCGYAPPAAAAPRRQPALASSQEVAGRRRDLSLWLGQRAWLPPTSRVRLGP